MNLYEGRYEYTSIESPMTPKNEIERTLHDMSYPYYTRLVGLVNTLLQNEKPKKPSVWNNPIEYMRSQSSLQTALLNSDSLDGQVWFINENGQVQYLAKANARFNSGKEISVKFNQLGAPRFGKLAIQSTSIGDPLEILGLPKNHESLAVTLDMQKILLSIQSSEYHLGYQYVERANRMIGGVHKKNKDQSTTMADEIANKDFLLIVQSLLDNSAIAI